MAKNKFSTMTYLCIGVLCIGIVFFNMTTKNNIVEGVGTKNIRWSEICTQGLHRQGKAKDDQRCLGQTRTYYGGPRNQYFDFATNMQGLYYGKDSNVT
jgi:hypothetical protein